MTSSTVFEFGQRFQTLPRTCFRRVDPTPLPAPYWLAINAPLAAELGLTLSGAAYDPLLAVFSGNALLAGMQPLAARYAGHQFGVFVPELGDGRAILLGDCAWGGGRVEVRARAEVQLKGAGPTPFSRMGDGRAVLRSSVREYLCSEAMYGLGIPTTRALCLIGSDQPVWRETEETSAVLTRVAPSFVRFGSFEALSQAGQLDELRALADFVIQHHFPECAVLPEPYGPWFDAVVTRSARLIAQWQSVGFCHGVMNSDNMSILGLTLDYGPFGFLDAFDHAHVCNHSDYAGRYAFKQQPRVAQWNLQCLAQAMLPLISEASLLAGLNRFAVEYAEAYLERMRAKLGLARQEADDAALVEALMQLLHHERVDYTRFFRRLSSLPLRDVAEELATWFNDPSSWRTWLARYGLRLESEPGDEPARLLAMQSVNPKYILRNYLAEQAIAQARDARDCGEIERLARCLSDPYAEQPEFDAYADLPPAWAAELSLSCSS